VCWLLREGGSDVGEADAYGSTDLIIAAFGGQLELVPWLVEHGGANIANIADYDGTTVWDELERHLVNDDGEDLDPDYDATAVTVLLRVMVLRDAPPAELITRLSPEHARVVQDGARLRAQFPAYLGQRHVLLDMHCPLIAPLQDLVHGFEVPTTTDELWATGLGAPLQRAKRSRPKRGQSTERRSARLRQKRLSYPLVFLSLFLCSFLMSLENFPSNSRD
jgi:hypothetical protein